MKLKFFLTILTAGMIFLFGSSSASASTHIYSFYNITNTISANVAIGKAQLSVEVTDEGYNQDSGYNQVLFTFRNTGDNFCSISEVYFADGSLLGEPKLIDKDDRDYPGDLGVDFELGANPPNLPSWDNADPPFVATADFSSQGINPSPKKGVNPDEWLGILFDLQGVQTFYEVIDELSTGKLRIGLHVTGFDLGESESFINNATHTPIPASVWMFGAGLIGLIGIRRKLVS